MPDYDNNMTGVLFKNDKKTSSSHPDYKGSCEIDNEEFWLAAWIKPKKSDGSKFMSLSFTPKNENRGAKTTVVTADVPIGQVAAQGNIGDDSDIPF